MVRMLRIARTRVLLKEAYAGIVGICFDVGFSNLSNFNRQLLREVGMTPRVYRRSVAPRRCPSRRARMSRRINNASRPSKPLPVARGSL